MRYLRDLLFVLLATLSLPLLAENGQFLVTELSAHPVDDRYLMDADIDYQFSEQALEALLNGVPLTLDVHVQLRRDGAWIWEEDLFDIRLRYQFRYHALAELYQVVDLQTGTEQDFVTRSAALKALGRLRDAPLVDAKTLTQGEAYVLSVQTSLDIDSLPLPLRPLAYLTPAWSLSSEKKVWYLRP